jgi:pilus assembly protein CpaE
MILFTEPGPERTAFLGTVLGPEAKPLADLTELTELTAANPTVLLAVLGPGVPLAAALRFADLQRVSRPALGVVLIRDVVDVQVLGDAIRAGIREVADAGDADGIRAACGRSLGVSRHLGEGVPQPGAPAREGVVLTVFSGKGGCGKSMVATNLAVALAAGGSRRVCLVDLDLSFGDVAIMLQLIPKRSLADAISMTGRLDETGLRSLLTPYRPGVDTLLAPAGPADGERIGRDLVSEALQVARRMFDYVVVDTPPYFSEPVLAALDLSQRYVLVATPDIPALKNLRLTLDMFDLLKYPPERRIVVLNRADARVGLTSGDIQRVIGAPIAGRLPSTRDVPVSINRGVPLVADSPKHPVSRSIDELIRAHLPTLEYAAPDDGPRRKRALTLRKGR